MGVSWCHVDTGSTQTALQCTHFARAWTGFHTKFWDSVVAFFPPPVFHEDLPCSASDWQVLFAIVG